MVTIGKFSYDGTNILGPTQYMKEKGNDKIDSITSGTDVAFNTMLQVSTEIDPVRLVLVALQTDYAGWIGTKQLADSLRKD